ILMGHSFGAGVALHCTATRADLVERLLLVDPSIFKVRSDLDHLVGTREELIARAAARPQAWESRAALRASLARRTLYHYWRSDHLDCYVEHGSRIGPDDQVYLGFSGTIE